MENMRKHWDIKLLTNRRRNELFSIKTKWSYHKVFHRYIYKKAEILLNKPAHVGRSVLELSKILIYEILVWLGKTKIW